MPSRASDGSALQMKPHYSLRLNLPDPSSGSSHLATRDNKNKTTEGDNETAHRHSTIQERNSTIHELEKTLDRNSQQLERSSIKVHEEHMKIRESIGNRNVSGIYSLSDTH